MKNSRLTLIIASIVVGITVFVLAAVAFNVLSSNMFASAAKTFFFGIGRELKPYLESTQKAFDEPESSTASTLRSELEAQATYVVPSAPTQEYDSNARNCFENECVRDPANKFKQALTSEGYTEVANPALTVTEVVPEGQQAIPKMIFMVERFGNDTPSYILQNIENIRNLNKDYTVNVYTEIDINTYMASAPLTLYNAYLACNNEKMAVNLFKFYVIYKQGGVFIDSDMELTSPLSDFIRPEDQYLLSDTSTGHPHLFDKLLTSSGSDNLVVKGIAPDGVYATDFIAAVEGHPYLLEFLVQASIDILNMQKIYEGTYAYTKGLRTLDERTVSRTIRGRYGRKFLAGNLGYTRAVAPLAAGFRRGAGKTFVDQPQHRFIGSVHAKQFPLRRIKTFSTIGYNTLSTLDGKLQDGRVVSLPKD